MCRSGRVWRLRRPLSGPLHAFEGPLGLQQVLGKPFRIDWESDLRGMLVEICQAGYEMIGGGKLCESATVD